jgi:hypothetical protein
MSNEAAAPTPSLQERMAAALGNQPESFANTSEPETAPAEAETTDEVPVEAAEEAVEATDQPTEGTEEAENLADVEIDGEVLKVHPKVKDAVMRHKDYTQKTMALADERKVFQAERQAAALQEAFQKEVAPDTTNLSKLEAQIDQFKQLNWAEMDTDQIVRARQALDGIKEQRDELKATIDSKRQEFLTNFSRSREQLLNQGAEYLKKTIPAWGETAQRESAQAALGVGFTKEEVSNFMDPRAVQLAWKAAQWDKLQSSKPSVTQKVKTAPPVSKPGSAATTESTASKAYAESRQRLKKSGSTQDAIAALLARR